jgi:hypothetical protein
MANYRDADAELTQALQAANGDADKAAALLLARIVVELQDQQARLKAVAEALGSAEDPFSV